MKRTFILVVAFLVVSFTLDARSESFTSYPCVDHENPEAVCAYDPASVIRMADKAKLNTRIMYPSSLPPNMITETYEIVVNCGKATYQITTGTKTGPSIRPATIVSRPVNREVLGSPYEGIFNNVCKKQKRP